ncbi:uncharacterized protein LOC134216607 [Armigeres subalbatus]|uniref:uncharacterized protein LOC134216607 n=1 Tax=Armigeres subalbatus TaxID=124917 RepID=UPI002ED59254
MSSPRAETKEETVELGVEELNSEEVETFHLLESFGLSIDTINTFIQQQYNLESLKLVERKELEELIPAPLSDRTKCIAGLNRWRKNQGLLPVTDCDCRKQSPAQVLSSVAETITRDKCTAAYLLNSSGKGKAIIQRYQESTFLTRSDKRIITHLVVDEFIDRFGKLTPSELLIRSKDLHELFPNEPQDSWYQPANVTDSSGKKVKSLFD